MTQHQKTTQRQHEAAHWSTSQAATGTQAQMGVTTLPHHMQLDSQGYAMLGSCQQHAQNFVALKAISHQSLL
jgi:hypothetical protein